MGCVLEGFSREALAEATNNHKLVHIHGCVHVCMHVCSSLSFPPCLNFYLKDYKLHNTDDVIYSQQKNKSSNQQNKKKKKRNRQIKQLTDSVSTVIQTVVVLEVLPARL